MRFWDASALVPLLLDEPRSSFIRSTYGQDAELVVWWASPVECASAIARRDREESGGGRPTATAVRSLADLRNRWQEVQPTDELREEAIRLIRQHPLRAADGLQLAAAIAASLGEPETLEFVALDLRLRAAATAEGIRVVSLP